MKYIAKMMLALLASVAMVAQAYAWDFGVSGSAEATFNQATSTPNNRLRNKLSAKRSVIVPQQS